MAEVNEFEGWAIVELMGHRKLAGYVRPAVVTGAAMLRLDVPGPGETSATQFYSPSALYCLTPCTEVLARQVAQRFQPEPVQAWELPRQLLAGTTAVDVDEEG